MSRERLATVGLSVIAITITAPFVIAFTSRPQKPRQTKAGDGLTEGAFDLAIERRMTFREARQALATLHNQADAEPFFRFSNSFMCQLRRLIHTARMETLLSES